MTTLQYCIRDEQGIHARPAGELVKTAKEFSCGIRIAKGGAAVDAKRIFGIMGLGAKKGDTVTMTFEGADEEAAKARMEEFLKASL